MTTLMFQEEQRMDKEFRTSNRITLNDFVVNDDGTLSKANVLLGGKAAGLPVHITNFQGDLLALRPEGSTFPDHKYYMGLEGDRFRPFYFEGLLMIHDLKEKITYTHRPVDIKELM